MDISEADAEHMEIANRLATVATELGIKSVQLIIADTLKKKPGLSLRDFAQVLDEHVKQMKQA